MSFISLNRFIPICWCTQGRLSRHPSPRAGRRDPGTSGRPEPGLLLCPRAGAPPETRRPRVSGTTQRVAGPGPDSVAAWREVKGGATGPPGDQKVFWDGPDLIRGRPAVLRRGNTPPPTAPALLSAPSTAPHVPGPSASIPTSKPAEKSGDAVRLTQVFHGNSKKGL